VSNANLSIVSSACANQSKANQSISASIGTDDVCSLDTTGLSIGPYEDNIDPITTAAGGAWDDFDFDQMLEQQFLNPSWLEDIQVQS
jgi:hypothetical protein